jgi:hypothetical protein
MAAVISARAEESIGRANRTLAIYRQQETGGSFGATMDTGANHGRAPLIQFYTESAILALISVGEEFSFSRLVDMTEERSPSDPIVSLLWDAELARSGDTWTQRDELWKRYFGIAAGGFSDRASLLGFVDARNAIAHGLGTLTRKQLLQKPKVTARLAQAGIALHGSSVILEPRHVEKCAVVVKGYIRWLDAAAA